MLMHDENYGHTGTLSVLVINVQTGLPEKISLFLVTEQSRCLFNASNVMFLFMI